MKLTLPLSLILLFFVLTNNMSTANENSQLVAFPSAKTNMQRFVINLPHKSRDEEQAFKVELLPGKTMMTDGVNQMLLDAEIEARPLKGWGYTYYEVNSKDIVISTKIGVPTNNLQTNNFVKGKPLTIKYNSRLPIVIYAKKGIELKYRIWRSDDIYTSVTQG